MGNEKLEKRETRGVALTEEEERKLHDEESDTEQVKITDEQQGVEYKFEPAEKEAN